MACIHWLLRQFHLRLRQYWQLELQFQLPLS